jgi:hypothetical protein
LKLKLNVCGDGVLTMNMAVIMSIIRLLDFPQPQLFGKWICFRYQIKREGKFLLIWAPYSELVSVAEPGSGFLNVMFGRKQI